MRQKYTIVLEKIESDFENSPKESCESIEVGNLKNKIKTIDEAIIGTESEYEEVIELYKTYGGD